jgi:hypothetical protein
MGDALTLRAWTVQRLAPVKFGGLAALVVLAATAPSPRLDLGRHVRDLLVATAMLLAWRLLDDLADRSVDRARHPARVLACAAVVPARFGAAMICSGAAGITLALTLPHPNVCGAALALVTAALVAWYRLCTDRGLLHTHVLLLKYPALALALRIPSGETGATAILSPVALYFALCAFELLEDGHQRAQHRVAPWAANLHLAALAAAVAVSSAWAVPALWLRPLAVATPLLLGAVAWSTRRAPSAPRAAYVPLIVSLALFIHLLPGSPS